MRALVFNILLFLSACVDYQHSDAFYSVRPNSKDTTINLKDSLGKIKIAIPNRFDTSFVWTHYSDDGNGQEKYRFQSKYLPINKERGWLWTDPTDSIDQLTIMHYKHLRLQDTTESAIRSGHLKSLVLAKQNPWMRNIIYDSVEIIDDKLFSIIAVENFDSIKKQNYRYLEAGTLLKGNIVRFEYKLLTKIKDSITDNFLKDSKRLLQQTKINGL